MDEAIGDELVEHVSDTHIRNKEYDEVSLEPGSSSMFQSNEMLTPSTNDYPESARKLYTDILDAKDLDRIDSSDNADVSPRCVNGAGVMVKELILKNYGEKLTVVGTSNTKGRTQTRKSQWQHLHQMAGESEVSNLHGQIGYNEQSQATSSTWEDEDDSFFSLLLDQNKPKPNFDHNEVANNLPSNGDEVASGDTLNSPGGIRTKILSKSGFSEYFIKSTLGGKGVIHKPGACRGSITESRIQDCPKPSAAGFKNSVASLSLTVQPVSRTSLGISESSSGPSSNDNGDGISLREWLEAGQNKENKVGSLSIFRQVLGLVDFLHHQGVSLQELRPSCFKLLGSSEIMYLGSFVCAKASANTADQVIHQPHHNQNDKRPVHQDMHLLDNQAWKKRKISEGMKFIQRWPQFPSRSGSMSVFKKVSKVDGSDPLDPGNCVDEEHNPKTEAKNQGNFFSGNVSNPSHPSQDSASCVLEEKWYTSPEEMGCTFASNIYNLGVLLFELLGSFGAGRSHAAAMLDLRYRILPPSFLSENPREAGFCLWLLHPEPSLRPTAREVLQSEFISGIQDSSGGELLSSIDEEDGESELLSFFLSSLSEQKQKDASNLVEQIHGLETDIHEVEERRTKKLLILSSSAPESLTASGSAYSNPISKVFSKLTPPGDKGTRLMSNIRKLDSAYFSMRPNIQMSDGNPAIHRDRELLKARENWCTMGREKGDGADHLGDFFDGFCKFARYNKFKVRGILRNGEFNSFTNVICSLSFDRDEDYLAAGLVSKKIKIFEFEALFNDSVDIHYPVVEMANKSKLSCICWNSYIKNYIASTDYEGIVKLWDAGTGQSFSRFIEHSERAWSVDFSRVNPMKLASGGDDRLVKLWSINEKNSLCTIRNHANVCCVQFSADSAHLLAFSSADYKTYCYDLRKASVPWCILAGHEKTVSYAKFLDAGTLVSASTDNTLKIWDLNKTSSNCLSKDACVLTLRGHTNEKNFVGLSAHDGYITCGSETNEVFAYYKSLSMPITAHKFGSFDSITGKETEDSNGQFVSSVCWRRKSNMVVAANSSGRIKLLQMV
ncbi:protein SPA1-RELATED 2-like isoform X1 [Primulina huaijiensis]|uniref:protein SPA1-RELATED 2-like isoform X1 n=1 Tax=Primulina huaijiensis TaxID=1492673 RepID=UPI003CC6ECDD